MKSVSATNVFRHPEGIRVGQPVVDGKKKCTKCKVQKTLDEFYKAGHLKTGFSHCITCCNERSAKRREDRKNDNIFI